MDIISERDNMTNKNDEKFDGYINTIVLPNGKKYKLQCEVVEIYPMTCPKCGGHVELKYGYGECSYCGTSFATNFKIVEQ